MPPGEPPRALVLQHSDLQLVIGKLARSCLSFQEAFLTKPKSPAGLLCQAWIPDVVEDNQIVLKTKNMPFCVAGMGDLLALFRCISCRFAFGTNVAKPATLGAPGRVFTSSEPEMCCNVQQYAKGAYLRKAEAEQCQVQSTLLLPLFISPRRTGCVGVLEVVQTSEDMAFADVATLLSDALERCDLFTCGMDEVRRHAPHAARRLTSVLLPPQTGVLLPPDTSSEPAGSGDGGASDGGKPGGGGAMEEDVEGGRGADSDDFSADEDDDEGSDGEGRRGGRGGKGGGAGGHRHRRKGTGNPGKPGVRLTLADLQSHFGVGLKEAAARLGICPTTLKRACRRHGIQRWPRRQLQKVNRALDELEARQMLQTQQHVVAGAPPAQAAALEAYGGLADPASDSRWTTLAQFIPAYQNGVAGQLGGSGLAGSGLGGSGLFGSMYAQQEQQLQQGLLPYAAPQLPGMQAPAQQQLLAQQAQQAALQQHALAGQPLAQQAPAPSHASLPDGALAMGAGTGGPTGGIIEVSTVSGVSTLGQPPPQAQQGASGGPPHGGAQAAAAQPRRSFDSFAQPAGTTAAGPPQQQSATSSGGAPRAAQYLQRASASAHYVSPFLPGNGLGGAGVGGGGMAPPILQLPTGLGDERAVGTVNLSAISVPSLPADVMPSLALAAGRGGLAGGAQQNGGGGGGLPDDDQVGFLDSSVLELLLSEERRGGLSRPGAQGQQNGNGAAAPATSVSVGELLPSSMALPGMSNGGVSGLSFML